MKTFALAAAVILSLMPYAHAQDAELSIDARRMLAYGTLAVMTKSCSTPLTSAQASELQSGMEKAAAAQKQLTPADFKEMMTAVGAQIGQNKEQVCSALTPEFVANALEEASQGQ